jgi:hypothetical protein
MGWTPQQVDACSLWEFLAARDGWIKANSPEDNKPPPPTASEHEAMMQKWA